MSRFSSAVRRQFVFALALILAAPFAIAQQATDSENPAPAAPAEAEPQAETGAEEAPQVTVTEHGDWQVRCETTSGNCFMYQLARNGAGNPVAEIRIVRLPETGEAAAGVTVITPLGSLLSEGLVLQVDDAEARQYPFNWCVQSGCFSQFGMTAAEVTAMRAGNVARMRIVAVSAPDQPVILDVSLTGFTAAHNALSQ